MAQGPLATQGPLKPMVNSYSIEDELSPKDSIRENLGRYAVFDLFLQEGDSLSLKIESDEFLPLGVLSSPGGQFFKNISQNRSNDLNLKVRETGLWSLYVVGGKTDVGHFKARLYLANQDAFKSLGIESLKARLYAILLHSSADFYFLEESSQNLSLPGALSFSLKGNVYNALLYKSSSREETLHFLNTYTGKIKDLGVEGLRVLSNSEGGAVFSFKNGDSKSRMTLNIGESSGQYGLSLEIRKEK